MTAPPPPRLRFALALLAITAAGAALRLHGVAGQPLISDETWAAATAVHYVQSGQLGPIMWSHPNLRNLVLWGAGEALGHGPVALRATSLLLGILSIPLLAALLRLLSGDRRASLIAAFLLAIEQVHVAFSRQAIQETWTTFFFLLGTTLAALAWRRQAPGWLAAAGVAFGLGVSSKLHALFPLAACAAAGLRFAWRHRSPAVAAWVVACLALIPAAIYLATFAPWFARGYGFTEWLAMQRVVLSAMVTHGGNLADIMIDTSAWQWFLRPMGYANFVLAEGRPTITLAHSNPAVWLLVLPAAAIAGRAAFADPEAGGLRFALALFAVSYLPLALSPRPIWLISSVAVIPFAFMLVGLAAARLLAARPGARAWIGAWGALAAAISLALHPMATGRADPHGPLGSLVERFRPPEERSRPPAPER